MDKLDWITLSGCFYSLHFNCTHKHVPTAVAILYSFNSFCPGINSNKAGKSLFSIPWPLLWRSCLFAAALSSSHQAQCTKSAIQHKCACLEHWCLHPQWGAGSVWDLACSVQRMASPHSARLTVLVKFVPASAAKRKATAFFHCVCIL